MVIKKADIRPEKLHICFCPFPKLYNLKKDYPNDSTTFQTFVSSCYTARRRSTFNPYDLGRVKTMSKFIINQNVQANGDYEVHNLTTGCSFMPYPQNRVDLGEHLNCFSAVLAAKRRWPNARINGCYYCCNACHTS